MEFAVSDNSTDGTIENLLKKRFLWAMAPGVSVTYSFTSSVLAVGDLAALAQRCPFAPKDHTSRSISLRYQIIIPDNAAHTLQESLASSIEAAGSARTILFMTIFLFIVCKTISLKRKDVF